MVGGVSAHRFDDLSNFDWRKVGEVERIIFNSYEQYRDRVTNFSCVEFKCLSASYYVVVSDGKLGGETVLRCEVTRVSEEQNGAGLAVGDTIELTQSNYLSPKDVEDVFAFAMSHGQITGKIKDGRYSIVKSPFIEYEFMYYSVFIPIEPGQSYTAAVMEGNVTHRAQMILPSDYEASQVEWKDSGEGDIIMVGEFVRDKVYGVVHEKSLIAKKCWVRGKTLEEIEAFLGSDYTQVLSHNGTDVYEWKTENGVLCLTLYAENEAEAPICMDVKYREN